MIQSLTRAIWPGEVHPGTPPPFVSSGPGVPVVFEYARAKDEALTATFDALDSKTSMDDVKKREVERHEPTDS